MGDGLAKGPVKGFASLIDPVRGNGSNRTLRCEDRVRPIRVILFGMKTESEVL